jgi:hypothetical protein
MRVLRKASSADIEAPVSRMMAIGSPAMDRPRGRKSPGARVATLCASMRTTGNTSRTVEDMNTSSAVSRSPRVNVVIRAGMPSPAAASSKCLRVIPERIPSDSGGVSSVRSLTANMFDVVPSITLPRPSRMIASFAPCAYLSYGNDAANVLFHVVNERHIRKRAMVFTTNKNPKLWGHVLHDEDLGDAIVDRILHRGRLLHLGGPSVRTKHALAGLEPGRLVTSGEGRELLPQGQVLGGLSAGVRSPKVVKISRPRADPARPQRWRARLRYSVARCTPNCAATSYSASTSSSSRSPVISA